MPETPKLLAVLDWIRINAHHSHIVRASVSAEARLRGRNQLTLPDRVVQAGGLMEGERFVVEIDPAEPETVRLHRIRATYAGSLRDVYGDPVAALEEARQGWNER
jgi:hypothetical protein